VDQHQGERFSGLVINGSVMMNTRKKRLIDNIRGEEYKDTRV